ncbi:OmpA family protein [uncultured Shewanella sp.]|uniref:OmpA family protein n=1 Tax=uncultured Shewanella sp. TaxID=173975 RepID=UPI0026238821|nr:OmpA family protein [uncultured Shewanella sp.]
MLLIRIIIISFSFIPLETFSSVENSQWWDYSIDSLGVGSGYSYAFNSQNVGSGSLNNINEISVQGWIANVNLILKKQDNSILKPYMDYTFLYHNDRQFNVLGLGIQFDFPVENTPFSFYFSGGGGYGTSYWTETPMSGYLINSAQSSSLVATFKTGMAYQLTPRLSLGLGLRYDLYDLDAKVVDSNFGSEDNITVIKDHGSVSALFEIKYFFSDRSRKSIASSSFYTHSETKSRIVISKKYLVYFDTRYSTFSQNRDKLLLKLKSFIASHQNYQILIQGHADAQGPKAYNQMLSQQRALSVKNFFVAHEIPINRIDISAQGETTPIADNRTILGRQKNRRVSVTFISN